MKRLFPFFAVALMLCACSSNKSKVANHLKNYHPDFALVDNQVTEGEGFCPYDTLQATCAALMKCENELRDRFTLDKKSAVAMAKDIKEKYGDVSSLLAPTGKNDRKTITMKCVSTDNEDDVRHVVFYMQKDEDEIDCCTLDFIAYEDDIMNKQRKLMELVEYVLSNEADNTAKAKTEIIQEDTPEVQDVKQEEKQDEKKSE